VIGALGSSAVRAQHQRNAEAPLQHQRVVVRFDAQLAERQQRSGRRGETAGREKTADAPVDVAAPTVRPRAAHFGQRSIEQVGADRGGRCDTHHEHQQRRHQRASAHACGTDEQTNEETRDCGDEIHAFLWASPAR